MISYFKSMEAQRMLRQDIEFTAAIFLDELPESGTAKEELVELLIKTAVDWARGKGYHKDPVSGNTREQVED